MILQPTIIGEKLPTLTNPGSAADLLAGKQFIDADGNVLTGTMPTQGAQTITPGTAAKTIAAGRYLTGTQTIQGDADLIAANIKSGVNIFGVTGAAEIIDYRMDVVYAYYASRLYTTLDKLTGMTYTTRFTRCIDSSTSVGNVLGFCFTDSSSTGEAGDKELTGNISFRAIVAATSSSYLPDGDRTERYLSSCIIADYVIDINSNKSISINGGSSRIVFDAAPVVFYYDPEKPYSYEKW